ncbi:MAG TPA: TetR/AcrR family transcriptional regulator [Candidatus Hydrogenedentes bacterium]|nr:TetR/AcrR family transcriptional regulator [Candidatus Hydrogenedentota bacterium]HIJ74179.1 TetR/AcrR family transcriptional regulator [Candidatus Hydrogenedentota bacterium]
MPEQKHGDTERRLLAGALSVFCEKGYDGASIREIIKRAEVTRPVLYYYFANKEGLFHRLVTDSFEQAFAEFENALAGVVGCRARLKALIRVAFARTECSPEVARFLLHVFFSPPQEGPQFDKVRFGRRRLGLVAALMREGIEAGELAGGDPETLALAFCGLMDMHIMAKAQEPERRLTPELGQDLVDLFMDGARSGVPAV